MAFTNETVGWASEPQGRGTIGLLWSCFATIFLCTWSAIHPNLPAEGDSAGRIFWRRVEYMLGCLVAPEWIAYLALNERLEARRMKAKSPRLGWSLKKCFFLRMGGFAVLREDNEWSHCQRLDPRTLWNLLQTDALSWPEVDDEEIEDRSKADWIIKLLALVQILWFTTQITGRAVEGLSITTLELFTLAIVFCAIIVYVALWEKPFDVRRPIIVHTKEDVPTATSDFRRVALGDDGSLTEGPLTEGPRARILPMILFVCLGFGALHIVAWNFHFPTVTEQILWRISSIGCMALPIMFILLEFLKVGDSKTEDILYFGLLGVYSLLRLYMFVEMLVNLRAVPASVYKTPQWSQYFPSFG